jgi:uncharacterized protein YjbI with pentapeptide repeats
MGLKAFLRGPDWRLIAWGAVLAIAVTVVLLILWRGPKWQIAYIRNLTPEQRLDRENEARKTLAQIIGGLFVLVGAGLTLRSLKLAERSQRENQQNAEETLLISLEGQITDRFTKAVAQLGSETPVVRLGGIYALERIARDSPRDYWAIMEILTTHVRETAKLLSNQPVELLESPPTPKPEIQAIITALGRREKRYEKPNQFLDLRLADLRGASMEGGDFNRADFTGASLDYVMGDNANFSEAVFQHGTLRRASLIQANLAGARLNYANLLECNLGLADLSRAMFINAVLTGAAFDNTKLSGTYLNRAIGLTREQVSSAEQGEKSWLPADLQQD